jgi:hypothetical protein
MLKIELIPALRLSSIWDQQQLSSTPTPPPVPMQNRSPSALPVPAQQHPSCS